MARRPSGCITRNSKRPRSAVAGFGAMWFGGPNQALAGDVAGTRARNDAHVSLAAKHPGMMPIATLHPYDGRDALVELTRVAGVGCEASQAASAHTELDITDPRVLALVKRAGELDVVVLMDNASIIPGDCENLFNLAVASPKTKFILAHIGGLNFRFSELSCIGTHRREFLRGQHLFRYFQPPRSSQPVRPSSRSSCGPCETWGSTMCY